MQTVINGVLTNYELINPKAKFPVVVLHGWGQNSGHWLPLAKKVSDRFRLYLLDLPGFGGTKNLADGSGIPEYVKFIKNFVTKNNLKRITLIGHSFVRKRNLLTRLKILAAKIIKIPTLLLPNSLRKRILTLTASRDYAQANPYQRSVLKKILRQDIGAKVNLIKVPTEIIWGSDDHVIPYMGKFLVENIPTANLHVIYPAGHLPHLTHPAKLATVLNQILEDEPA